MALNVSLEGEVSGRIEDSPGWAGTSNTRRTYETAWVAFSRWCDDQNLAALPATSSTVASYIAARSELVTPDGERVYAPSTIAVWVAAINARHRRAGLPSPGTSNHVREMVAGLRLRSDKATRTMAPLLLADLKLALEQIDVRSFPGAAIGLRDSAILLMGFVGAFRRSELASVRVGDIALSASTGLLVRRVTPNTGTEKSGDYKRLPFGANTLTCPPCAAIRWLQVLAVADSSGGRTNALRPDAEMAAHVCVGWSPFDSLNPGALLLRSVHRSGHVRTAMSSQVVDDVVKRRLAAVGLDTRRYGSESLRSGFIAQAMLDGANSEEIREQTGHLSVASVERYRRRHSLPHGNAVTRLKL